MEVKPIGKAKKQKISWAILGPEIGSDLADLEIAAKILKGKKLHPEVKMLIVPASKTVYLKALKKNLIRIFLQAGCWFFYPGANSFKLFEDEKIITTCSSVFPDRAVYLASAASVAASALKGKISDPREFLSLR